MKHPRLFAIAASLPLLTSMAPKAEEPKTCPPVVHDFNFNSPDSGAFILPESDSFTILSMNIQNMSIKNKGYPSNRMECLGKLAENFDIVAYQENFEKKMPRPQDMISTSRTPSPFYMYNGSGLTQFTKGHFSDVVFKPYSVCSGVLSGASDCLARKGVEKATVHFNNINIPVITTHMDAGRREVDIQTRITQLGEMGGVIPQDGAMLLVGDFNMHWGREDAALDMFLQQNNLTLYLRSDEKEGYDIVAGRGLKAVSSKVIPQAGLSDHDGLALKFRPVG